MADIKRSLSKYLATVNVKTNNFMEINKIKTYIDTLEEEINQYYLSIGKTSFEMWENDTGDYSDIENLFEEISEKNKIINQQEEKIDTLLEQEKQILGEAKNNTSNGVIYCPQCGVKNAANYKFCVKCGGPLT